MRKFNQTVLVILILFGILSCVEEGQQIPLGEFEKGVLVINEGAFGVNDGEIYHYDPITGLIKSNIFEGKNRRPFAGLIQDMVEAEGRLYLVANTGKVEVVDPRDFLSKGAVVEGLDISRSIVTTNQKLFIADWGPYDANFNSPNSYVAVVDDLDGGGITKKIPVSSRPEKMFVSGNQIFVATTAGKKLEVISLDSETITSFQDLEGSPGGFFELLGTLILYAYDAEMVYFHQIDKTTGNIQGVLPVGLKWATSNFTLSEDGEMLIITSTGWPDYNDAIARVSIVNRQVLNEAIFTGSGFYGIGYHPGLKEIYVGDNNGFQGNGTVIVLDQNGQQKKSFAVGRGPSGFLVKE
ncbi:surface layer protein [Cyclobacteriaceae bacterium YHN15]|nr:surface layer protein [Cyclobacteriaceae bacterium YHN15]